MSEHRLSGKPRSHNPKVCGSNPPPRPIFQVIDISRWPFSLSEGSASGGGPRNDGPLSFRLITGYKMLTGIILISILGKCRESFTRSSGNLPSLVLPVHERACERIDARKGEGARRFDACDRRRDVRSALMLIAVRYEVHAVVGYERGRAAKSGPDCFVEHGFAAFPGWLWCGAL